MEEEKKDAESEVDQTMLALKKPEGGSEDQEKKE